MALNFVSPVKIDGKDGGGLKLENIGPMFSIFFFRIPAKITNKINKLCAP